MWRHDLLLKVIEGHMEGKKIKTPRKPRETMLDWPKK